MKVVNFMSRNLTFYHNTSSIGEVNEVIFKFNKATNREDRLSLLIEIIRIFCKFNGYGLCNVQELAFLDTLVPFLDLIGKIDFNGDCFEITGYSINNKKLFVFSRGGGRCPFHFELRYARKTGENYHITADAGITLTGDIKLNESTILTFFVDFDDCDNLKSYWYESSNGKKCMYEFLVSKDPSLDCIRVTKNIPKNRDLCYFRDFCGNRFLEDSSQKNAGAKSRIYLDPKKSDSIKPRIYFSPLIPDFGFSLSKGINPDKRLTKDEICSLFPGIVVNLKGKKIL